MGYAYLRRLDPPGPLELVEIIELSPGSPPARPQPEPTPPGIWGPTDPRPENPIPIYPGGTPNPPGIWGPPGPWPTPPIAGIPGLPGYEPPKPGDPPRAPMPAVVVVAPADSPIPDTPPANSAKAWVSFGPGTKPAAAWIAPYATTGPVEPPTGAAGAKK